MRGVSGNTLEQFIRLLKYSIQLNIEGCENNHNNNYSSEMEHANDTSNVRLCLGNVFLTFAIELNGDVPGEIQFC